MRVVVRHRVEGGYETYDVSGDLESCRVERGLDGPSSFTFSLDNRGGKYTGLFEPMDMAAVYASKGAWDDGSERRLLTGYITSCDRYRLFDAPLNFTARDLLYRLERLYWDPRLGASVKDIWSKQSSGLGDWGGYSGLLRQLLVDVGGVPEGQVAIGGVPAEVIELARGLYMSQNEQYEQAERVLRDIARASASLSVSGSQASGSTVVGDFGDLVFSAEDGDPTAKQRAVVDACNRTAATGEGWCAAWVCDAFDNAASYTGFNAVRLVGADDYFRAFCNLRAPSPVKPGMIVAVPVSGYSGSLYGHIGIYVGNGIIMHNGAGVTRSTWGDWWALYSDSGRIDMGWGWMNGEDLSA